MHDPVPEQTRLTPREKAPIYTVGHSTRSLDALVDLLHEHDVTHLVDVRRFPNSQRHPHFNQGNLAQALPEASIAYEHREVLGGYRTPPEDDSPNTGWPAEGLIAYADHACTDAWQVALEAVLETADELAEADDGHVCVMCAEKRYRECHRRILSDHVLARARQVHHIVEPGRLETHEVTDLARVRGTDVVYPG